MKLNHLILASTIVGLTVQSCGETTETTDEANKKPVQTETVIEVDKASPALIEKPRIEKKVIVEDHQMLAVFHR